VPQQGVAGHLHAVLTRKIGDRIRLTPAERVFCGMNVLCLHGVFSGEVVEITGEDLGLVLQMPGAHRRADRKVCGVLAS
jgi:hypothetical protein